ETKRRQTALSPADSAQYLGILHSGTEYHRPGGRPKSTSNDPPRWVEDGCNTPLFRESYPTGGSDYSDRRGPSLKIPSYSLHPPPAAAPPMVCVPLPAALLPPVYRAEEFVASRFG